MLLSEVRDQIVGRYGRQNDYEFSERVSSLIKSARVEVIRRFIDKNGKIPSYLIQQINCIEVEEINISECEGVNLCEKVCRSVKKIPSTIRLKNTQQAFHFVGTINNSKQFSYTDSEKVDFYFSEPSLSKVIRYSYINNYIYLYGACPKYIRVKGIFSDPFIIDKFNGEPCSFDQDLNDDLVYQIKELIYDELRIEKIEDFKEDIEIKND